MNFKSLATAFLMIFVQISSMAQPSFGEAIKINDDWEFKNREFKDEFKKKADMKEWRKIDLPHDWSVEGPHSPDLASCTGFLPGGIGWYRKSLNIPEGDKGKRLYIYFEGVYCNSEVWINDHYLGKRPNGYISFMYDMTPYIHYGQKNVLLVKVDHSKYADSRWYTGSGIYRDVYLVKANPVHIDLWGVFCSTDQITSKEAVLSVKASIRNTATSEALVTVEQKVTKKGEQKVLAKAFKKIRIAPSSVSLAEITLKIEHPLLWSTEHPDLYEVHTSIVQNNKVIDTNILRTGIRSFVSDPNKGFSLNGKEMKLKGACIHHDAGALGAAVPAKVWEKRLRDLKAIGCNAIRTSHNPQADAVYDICDEIGLLVMDEAFDEWEFPKRKWMEGWNVGVPGYDGYATSFNEWGERDMTDMVLMHRNHPSIIMWSIGNEVDYPNDPYSHPVLDTASINQKSVPGYKPDRPDARRLGVIAKKLADGVKKADPTRPVTAALAGVVMSNFTDYPFVLDVTGYNYTESRYQMDHEKYPSRKIYGSENRHDLEAWKAVKDNDYISGQFIWTGFDYLGEAGQWPSRGAKSGLFDLAGFKKPQGYYRESLWSDKPVIYIGTTNGNKTPLNVWEPTWNYRDGENVKIICFTNCEKVVLKLNGRTIDTKPVIDKNTGAGYWTIPFEKGTLTASAYNGGKEVAVYQLKTAGRPEVIVCKPDVRAFHGKGDLVQIEVSLCDKNGTPVFSGDDEITCNITGPAKVIGLENGHPTDMVNYKTNKLRVYKGRLRAYVVSTADSGQVELEFVSNWLKPSGVSLVINRLNP